MLASTTAASLARSAVPRGQRVMDQKRALDRISPQLKHVTGDRCFAQVQATTAKRPLYAKSDSH
jgi:hypothetical protein